MSWIPGPAERILPTLKILCEAAEERISKFGITAGTALLLPDAPIRRDTVKSCMTALRDRILLLLRNSLNPMQFGSWCDFAPFAAVSADEIAETAALLDRELPSSGCDWEAFLLVPPQPVCRYSFVQTCGKLLDEVILWRSPCWKAGGPGVLGADARLSYRDLEYEGRYDAAGWQREGNLTVSIGRNSRSVDHTMIAKWYRGEYLVSAQDHTFLNQGPIRFCGEWLVRYRVTAVEEKRISSTQRNEYAGEVQTATFQGDRSDALIFPFPASLPAEIGAHGDDENCSFHTLTCRIVPENKAFWARANMPALNYTYKD